MTFTFNSDTIANEELVFSIPGGPEFAYLQLWSQLANQQLKGDVVAKTNAWTADYIGLVLTRLVTNSRYTSYKFLYAQPGGLDDIDILFTKDIAGVYNYRLVDFVDDFKWNLNSKEWHLETRVWNFNSVLDATILDSGMLAIKNTIPYTAPARITYVSPNEKREGYVYLTNNSI
jgi:hypothetical protein